jgi:hypothetical protein
LDAGPPVAAERLVAVVWIGTMEVPMSPDPETSVTVFSESVPALCVMPPGKSVRLNFRAGITVVLVFRGI